MTSAIPDGYPRLVPYLHLDGAEAAMAFYAEVLGAAARGGVMHTTDGRVGHAEMTVGDSVLMLADESPASGVLGPRSTGGTPVTIHVYVEDVDATFERAVEAGASVVRPVADQFYGDRVGVFEDPFGHRWSVATHVEDVSPEEMRDRMAGLTG